MKLYKLTDENCRTFNDTQWGEGITHSGTGEGQMCGPGWIHAYTDPVLAVFLNPIHAGFKNPRLWECEGEVEREDHGLKVGCKSLTTIKEIPLPEVNTTRRIAFGILCAKEVFKDRDWAKWADGWLDGSDRSRKAAYAAAAYDAAAAAYAAAAYDAAAAYADAAYADAAYADAAYAAAAYDAAAAAYDDAAYAARSASRAALSAPIDLIAIAHKALEIS